MYLALAGACKYSIWEMACDGKGEGRDAKGMGVRAAQMPEEIVQQAV